MVINKIERAWDWAVEAMRAAYREEMSIERAEQSLFTVIIEGWRPDDYPEELRRREPREIDLDHLMPKAREELSRRMRVFYGTAAI